MAEKTVELEIPILLPNIDTDRDASLTRLETLLQNQKGLQRVHLERDRQPITLCLHYDPEVTSLADVKRLALRAGAQVNNRYHHALIPIEGMDCSDCVLVIEHSVGRIEGVLSVDVNYATQKMRVEYDRHKTDRAAIEKRLRSLGYTVPTGGFQSWYNKNRTLLFSIICGSLLLTGWVGEIFFGLPGWVSTSLYLTASLFGAWDIAHHAWYALRERRFDTDFLMVVAALGAIALGRFAESALLLFLISLGHALEERALDRARSAVRALADLVPRSALVRRDGSEIELSVEQLQLGDIVIVRPGGRIAVDGVVLSGRSGVNQAPVTGESVPVDKAPGEIVYASTVNGEGALEVRVTRLAKDSTLARVMRMVEEAQTQKSPTQQTIEKFERVFVPAILIITGLVIVIPPLFGIPFEESFMRAMTLLVAASPCALALGTPAAILAGIAQAARNGVLTKGSAHLENLGRLKAIAFDKTGTITNGQPEVTAVLPIDPAITEDGLLALAAAVESRSGHPLAKAVVRAWEAKDTVLPHIGEVESLTGRGVRSEYDGQRLLLGNLNFLEENKVLITPETRQQVEILYSQGNTVMLISLGSSVTGLLALADILRPEAAHTMAALKQIGLGKTIMLTGDNERVAEAIAHQAGLSDFRANLMPEDKLTAVRDLLQELGEIGMVGDGVNDAPALASATVGIAMGGAGTDVALETADVALMGDDLSKLPFAIGLGRGTRAIISQNLVIAMGVIVMLAIASLTGLASIGVAIVFHEGSTILVVLNALRLLGYKLPT